MKFACTRNNLLDPLQHTDDMQMSKNLTARCVCGCVVFQIVGSPIVSASCYCSTCQTAGREIEQLPAAPKVLDPDGGTSYLLYRKDHVVCVKGNEHLREIRLKPDSPTRRVVADCCNSAMFLDFTKGHWLTMYRGRLPSDAPPLEMRIMTRDRPRLTQHSNDVPNYKGRSGKFMWKLLRSRIAMLLGR